MAGAVLSGGILLLTVSPHRIPQKQETFDHNNPAGNSVGYSGKVVFLQVMEFLPLHVICQRAEVTPIISMRFLSCPRIKNLVIDS
jgi:hypothetical protein